MTPRELHDERLTLHTHNPDECHVHVHGPNSLGVYNVICECGLHLGSYLLRTRAIEVGRNHLAR